MITWAAFNGAALALTLGGIVALIFAVAEAWPKTEALAEQRHADAVDREREERQP